jgi:hypothetical protein
VFGSPSVVVTLGTLPKLGYRRLCRVQAARRRRRLARQERRRAEKAWLMEQRAARRAARKGKRKVEQPGPAVAAATPAAPAVTQAAVTNQDAQRVVHPPTWPLRSYRGNLPLPFAPCTGDLGPLIPEQTDRSAADDQEAVRVQVRAR